MFYLLTYALGVAITNKKSSRVNYAIIVLEIGSGGIK